VLREVPVIQYQEVIREVPREVVKEVYRDVEVPRIHEVIREVQAPAVVEVVQAVIIETPVMIEVAEAVMIEVPVVEATPAPALPYSGWLSFLNAMNQIELTALRSAGERAKKAAESKLRRSAARSTCRMSSASAQRSKPGCMPPTSARIGSSTA
jgi:hypothetical protein